MSIELKYETIKEHRITRYKGCLIYQSGKRYIFNGELFDTIQLAQHAVHAVLGLIKSSKKK